MSHLDDFTAGDSWNDLIGVPGDEVERLAVQEVTRRQRNDDPVSVLDADCGHGTLAVRLAQAGASVTALIDCAKGPGKTARGLIAKDLPIAFVACRAIDLTAPPAGGPFDLIVLRRSLPFLRYAEATALLTRLNGWLKIGGKIIVSTFGVHSHFGDAYPDVEKPVQKRFAPLPDELARQYGIAGPICLYSERDLFILVFESGIGVLRSFTTT
ncbi:MAG TPA: methyltransferase domain-containing protein, partial [Rhodocyclaceae bacterium]